MYRPKYKILLILALIVVLNGTISACGQKGPLYLPDPQDDQNSP